MRIRVKVIEVGWQADFDGNRHPYIRIGRRAWSAVLYDHPAEGWQVLTLEIARRVNRRTQVETYEGAEVVNRFEMLIGGEVDSAALDVLAAELYETGRQGAAKRWVGKTITLDVHSTKGDQWAM